MQNTGLIKEHFLSERDYDYEAICGSVQGGYPTYYKLPEECTGTQKDQKATSYCLAMVIASISEAYWNRTLGINEEQSEAFIYGAFRSENSQNSGLVATIALQAWCDIGTVYKKEFNPGLLEMPEVKEFVDKHPELKDIAKHLRLSAYTRLKTNAISTRDEQIKDAITKHGYGLVAINRNHAIQLVGWDDEKDRYILKDSYGTDNGDNGYIYTKKNSIDAVYLPIFEPVAFPFKDVPEDAWYYEDVKHMFLAGIMNGTSEDTFEPDKPITRAEAAALCNRILKAMDTRDKIMNDIANEWREIKG